MIFSLYPDEKKSVFEILGTNYILVKEAVYYSNAAVISPRANGTKGTNSYYIFSFLEIDCSRGM